MDTTQLVNLIDRSRSGDREAFGVIVRQYQSVVSSVTFGILGDFHRSEDVAQETFLVAWKKLAELKDVQYFPGWICGIAKNLAQKDRVKTAKKPAVTLPDDSATNEPDPLNQAIREEQNRLVLSSLDKIPEKYRVPLMLHYRSDKSMSEIAVILSISEETARKQVYRAKRYLRSELERQIKGAAISSGPGELFTLAVLAALPAVATFSTTGKAVAATVVGAESTFAASAMIAAPKSSGGTSALFATTTFSGVASLLLANISQIFCYFFWIIAAIPGIWYAVRNAPSLRARRYLILTSLRANVLLSAWMFIMGFVQAIVANFFIIAQFFGVSEWYYDANILIRQYIGPMTVWTFAAIILFLSVVTPLIYRRILREDAGLVSPRKMVPLEESSLSFNRISRSCRISFYIIVTFLGIGAISCIVDFFTWRYAVQFVNNPVWVIAKWYQGGQYLIAGLLYLPVFWLVHKGFLHIARDEASYAAAPPITDSGKPFGERVFIEWVFHFGCFLVAGIFSVVYAATSMRFVPFCPILLLGAILAMLAGSYFVAMLSVRLPFLRWFVTCCGGFLVAFSVLVLFGYSRVQKESGIPFDSPTDWPIIFGIMIVESILVLMFLAVYLLSSLHYRKISMGKTNRFSLGRKIKMATAMIFGTVLLTSYFVHSSVRVDYFGRCCIFNQNDHAIVSYCDAILQLTPENTSKHCIALRTRAEARTNLTQYDAAIADFDRTISMSTPSGMTQWELQYTLSERGNVKFLKGDLHGAIADYDAALEPAVRNPHAYYHRGFAQEKLGNIDAAVADYTRAIDALAPSRAVDPSAIIWSRVPRTGYDDAQHQLSRQLGYRLSLDELITIRDKLREQK